MYSRLSRDMVTWVVRLRCFDCLLLVFIRRWGWLLMCHLTSWWRQAVNSRNITIYNSSDHIVRQTAINTLYYTVLLYLSRWTMTTISRHNITLFFGLLSETCLTCIFSWQNWRMDTDGWLPADIAARGVKWQHLCWCIRVVFNWVLKVNCVCFGLPHCTL